MIFCITARKKIKKGQFTNKLVMKISEEKTFYNCD